MTLPPAGPHGGDALRIAAAAGLDASQVLDLSASLNPFAPDPSAIIAKHLGALHHYPDASNATEQMAQAVGVPADRLVLTNGGAEAIALVANLLERGSVRDPDFSLYRRHLTHVDPAAGRWRSNPSSPLGSLAAVDETAEVWDEAFYPIATGTWTRGDSHSWRLGSLTKLWSCPGLRLGYLLAPTATLAGIIRDRQPRWSVNGMALAALPDFLSETDLFGWHCAMADLRTEFVVALQELGLDVQPSTANWVLLHEAGDLRYRLIERGIVVRDCSSFGMPTTVRVALPNPTNLDRVLSAIAESLHS